jgi:hypothetical protein
MNALGPPSLRKSMSALVTEQPLFVKICWYYQCASSAPTRFLRRIVAPVPGKYSFCIASALISGGILSPSTPRVGTHFPSLFARRLSLHLAYTPFACEKRTLAMGDRKHIGCVKLVHQPIGLVTRTKVRLQKGESSVCLEVTEVYLTASRFFRITFLL